MNAYGLAGIALLAGLLIGFLITRRWRLPTAKGIADTVSTLGGTGSVTVLAGIAGFVGILFVVGAGASLSVLHEMVTGHPLDPSTFWERVLDSLLIAVCAFAGLGFGGKLGQRATTKPEVIEAEARAEAVKKQATAHADAMVIEATRQARASGANLRTDVP